MSSTRVEREASSARATHHIEQHLGTDVHTVHSAHASHAALEAAEHFTRVDEIFAAVVSRSFPAESNR